MQPITPINLPQPCHQPWANMGTVENGCFCSSCSKAVMLLMRVLKGLFSNVTTIIANGGYRGEIARQVKDTFGYLIQVVMRSDDKQTGFKPIHKRWVVERTFAWFDWRPEVMQEL